MGWNHQLDDEANDWDFCRLVIFYGFDPMGFITIKSNHLLGEYVWNFIQASNKQVQDEDCEALFVSSWSRLKDLSSYETCHGFFV